MLTQAKVERLLTDLSARARAETAAIVAEEFTGGSLSESERRIAIDILTVLANDVELQVREALAEQVSDCPFLPAAIALTLAHDLDPVAVPILRFSPVLTDLDLVALVRTGSTEKQIAIARRDRVAEIVCDALVDTRKRQVVSAVLANHGATLSEATLAVLVDRYRDDPAVHLLMADRPVLPPTIVEQLFRCASAEVAARLLLRDPVVDAAAAPAQGRDRAFSQLLAALSPGEIERLAAELHRRDMLSSMLLLRCLIDGHLFFVEAAIAIRAGIGLAQARPLIHDIGPLGLPAVYTRAGLAAPLLPAFRAVLGVLHDIARRGGDGAAPQLEALILSALREAYPHLPAGRLDAMLAGLATLAAGAGRA